MPAAPLLHDAPAGADAASLAARLAEQLGGTVEPARSERRAVLDTFDWRLHRKGVALEHVTDAGDGPRLVLRQWGGPTLLTLPAVPAPPSTTTDLPGGRLRDKVAPMLDTRALVETVAYDVVVHRVVVRNDDAKAVARVAVDDLGRGELVVRPLPVRGYDRAAERVAATLVELGCAPGAADPAATALGRAGRRAGGNPGALKPALDARGSAATGWVAVLITLLDEVEANVPGAVEGTDPEHLHELRVAVRRSRSALRHAQHVVPKELRACFRPELKWLQVITSNARDLDVYVEAATADASTLDGEARSALEPFLRLLAERRAQAQARLAADLQSEALRALLDDWRATLSALRDAVGPEAEPTGEAGARAARRRSRQERGDRLDLEPMPPAHPRIRSDEAGEWGPWPADAHRGLADVAAERIRAQHRLLLRDGARIDDRSPAADLHELRKEAKELRYLVELFGPALASERTKPFVKALKRLQDVLGEHQDTEVQVQAVRAWADELAQAGGTGASTLLALGEMVERLQQRQAAARAGFTERFSRFAAAGRP